MACLSYDTFISTNRGLVPVQELRVGDMLRSVDGFDELTEVYSCGSKPVKVLLTASDLPISGDPLTEVMLAYDKFLPLSRINRGELVKSSFDFGSHANVLPNFPLSMQRVFSKEKIDLFFSLLGYMLCSLSLRQFIITSRTKTAAEEISKLLGALFEESPDCSIYQNQISYDVGMLSHLPALIEHYKIANHPDRIVQKLVMPASEKNKIAFLRALLNSCRTRDSKIVIPLLDYLTRRQVQLLLVEFGIHAETDRSDNLVVDFGYAHKLISNIGTDAAKVQTAASATKTKFGTDNKNAILRIAGVSEEPDVETYNLATRNGKPILANSIFVSTDY